MVLPLYMLWHKEKLGVRIQMRHLLGMIVRTNETSAGNDCAFVHIYFVGILRHIHTHTHVQDN